MPLTSLLSPTLSYSMAKPATLVIANTSGSLPASVPPNSEDRKQKATAGGAASIPERGRSTCHVTRPKKKKKEEITTDWVKLIERNMELWEPRAGAPWC